MTCRMTRKPIEGLCRKTRLIILGNMIRHLTLAIGYRPSFVVFAFSLLLLSCKSHHHHTQVILKFCHQVNERDIWHKAAVYFADEVDSLSEGRIRVDVYPSEQLGTERDMIRSIKAGIADMTTTGESLQNWAPVAALCAVPYLIRDSAHLQRVIDGPIAQKISREVISEIGLRPLAFLKRGARELTSNRPIRSPDDLKGIILRLPNVPISVKMWEALGAKPTPMALSEVFTALQQGTVEAEENPFAVINSSGFYEVQQYVNLTDHVYGWVFVVIGEKQFEKLSNEDQQVLLQAGRDMQAYHARLFDKEEAQLRKELKDHGMTFVQVDKKAFSEKAAPVVLNSLPASVKPLYYQIKNSADSVEITP
jgi:TRAP-type transport system periplasmic protein